MTDTTATLKLRASTLTDVGMVREHNEDSAMVDPDHRFFVVADGMGGHAAGEVASAMAVEEVAKALRLKENALEAFTTDPSDTARRDVVQLLEEAVRSAHQAVFERGAHETDKQGMGTTLDVVVVAGREAFVAHVGDSRTYLIRNGKAAQITTDHTVAEVLVIEGKLSMEEAQASPLRTILVNAVGVAPDVGVEMSHVKLRKGDQLLLCSDGLHDYFPVDQELADYLTAAEPDAALSKVVSIAKQRGGHDNITGVVIEVLECPADLDSEDDDTETSDGVPTEIGVGDTVPVDVGIEPPPLPLRAERPTKPIRAQDEIMMARTTEPMDAVEPPDLQDNDADDDDIAVETDDDDDDEGDTLGGDDDDVSTRVTAPMGALEPERHAPSDDADPDPTLDDEPESEAS